MTYIFCPVRDRKFIENIWRTFIFYNFLFVLKNCSTKMLLNIYKKLKKKFEFSYFFFNWSAYECPVRDPGNAHILKITIFAEYFLLLLALHMCITKSWHTYNRVVSLFCVDLHITGLLTYNRVAITHMVQYYCWCTLGIQLFNII